MRRLAQAIAVMLLALLTTWQPLWAAGRSAVRLIPQEKVTLLEDGKPTRQFRSEVPLPEGLTLRSSGKCLLQADGLQLMAQDKAVFALNQNERRWDLAIRSGRIDFTLRADARPVAFHTPAGLLETEQALVPASTGGLIKGYVEVQKDRTSLVVEEGALRLRTAQGVQLAQNGQPIILAQFGEIPAGEAIAAAGAATGGGTAGAIAGGASTAAIFSAAGLHASGATKGGGGEVSPF